MPLIPNEMVRKMMGLMNTFTTSIKYFPRGCIFTPRSGEKCPNNAPEVIASKTQKVRLVISFLNMIVLVVVIKLMHETDVFG
jgi:hypothetical protein